MNPLRPLFLTSLAWMVLSLLPSAVLAGGFNPSGVTRQVIQKTLKPRKVAMVVGIDRYDDPSFARLSYAQSDAEAFAGVLQDKKFGGFDEVHLYVSDPLTTRQQFLTVLQAQLNKLGMFDTFVLYFSGHGSLTLTATPPISGKGGASGSLPSSQASHHSFSLVFQDTKLQQLAETGVSLDELRTMLGKSRAARKAVILDSCFAGDGKSQVTEQTRQLIQQSMSDLDQEKLEPTASAWLLAAQLGSNAYEDPQLQHGVYTHFLLDAMTDQRQQADLNNDGALSAWEAHDYARARTVEQAGRLKAPDGQGLTQQPEAFLHVVGVQDIYLSGEPESGLKSASSLIYSYGTGKGSRGWEVEVDGEQKGAFPKAVSVAPGRHRVKVYDENGQVQASGPLTFGQGQIYSVGLLMEELKGYRRVLALRGVGTQQLGGNGSEVWGDRTGGLTLQSGYRIRGGWLRGLTFLGEVGWQGGQEPGSTLEGAGNAGAVRPIFSLGGEVMLRRSLGPLELGVGGFAGLQAAVPESFWGGGYTCSGQAPTPECVWFSFPYGPAVWAGWRLDKQLQLSVETRLPFFPAFDFEQGAQGANVQLQLLLGLELDL